MWIKYTYCSMHFDDSLFEDDSEQQKKRVNVSQINYTAKRCELDWFMKPKYDKCTDSTSPDSDFMLTKFRADLAYRQKQYSEAVALYEATLQAAPPTNTVVGREVTDSLARCRLRLGQPHLALEKAQQLVCPSHKSDSSAWKLIADCQEALADTAGRVQSLQKCASLQRYQFNYWTSLASAYTSLGDQYLANTHNTDSSNGDSQTHPSHMTEEQTYSSHMIKETQPEHRTVEWKELLPVVEATIALFRPYYSWVSLSEGHRGDSAERVRVRQCLSPCIFSEPSPTHCGYTDVAVEMAAQRQLSVNFEPTSSLCLSHCPFTMLQSGRVHLMDWMAALERLTAAGHSVFVRECVHSYLMMAGCSCLLWARQLLLYLARYSHSFVKEAHTRALGELETQLQACDSVMVTFLESYFNKNRVFEESQNKDGKQ